MHEVSHMVNEHAHEIHALFACLPSDVRLNACELAPRRNVTWSEVAGADEKHGIQTFTWKPMFFLDMRTGRSSATAVGLQKELR